MELAHEHAEFVFFMTIRYIRRIEEVEVTTVD